VPDEPRLEEQALSQAAEMGISSQLDAVENIDVDVRTDLLKMVRGQANSVSVAGQGMVMQKEIRVQEIELHTNDVVINPLSAIFGQIQLEHPVDADVRVVMTEADINRALNSEYVRNKMQSLKLNVEGETVMMEMQQMELLLPGGGQMVFNGRTLLHELGDTRPVSFTASFQPRTLSQPLRMRAFQCTEGEGLSIEFLVAFMKKLEELTDLPFHEVEGMALRIKDMDVQQGSMTVLAEAHVKQLPSP
jgi:hypothetical protein